MKTKLFFVFFNFLMFFSCLCFGQHQSTWVKTLHYETMPSTGQTQDSLWIGPQKIVRASDETYFVLNKDAPGYSQSIYHVDSMGNILSSILVGYRTSSTETTASNLYATPDSGCIYLETFSFLWPPDFKLYKISKNGVRSLIHNWANSISGPIDIISSVVPNQHGGFYCNIDSNFIDLPPTIMTPGKICFVFANDDYIVEDSLLSRIDTAGNIIWTIPNRPIIACSETSIYFADDSLVKVNAVTGNKLWTKTKPPGNWYDIMHSTDGLVSVDNRMIFVLDSSGSIVDSNLITLTLSRLTTVASGIDGSIFTGGGFVNYNNFDFYRRYSSFLIKVNEEANGTVDSCNFFLAGDANNNSDVLYIEDGLFVAAALGQSTNITQVNENILSGYLTYSELWPEESDCGINYRFSDGVMDGTINIDDITFLDQHNNHYAHENNDSTGSLVRIIYDNATVNPGDTIRASVILGSTSNPTDSIYGFSIEPIVSYVQYFGSTFEVEYKNNVIGDTATNLNIYVSDTSLSNSYLGMIFCRNDHQNISIAGDTIFRISAIMPPFMPVGNYMFPNPSYMITEGGCFVPVNVISDTLNIVLTTSENLDKYSSVKIFPNPANEEFTIETESRPFEKIKITDLFGKIVLEKSTTERKNIVSTTYLKNGIYIIETRTGITSNFHKLIVSH